MTGKKLLQMMKERGITVKTDVSCDLILEGEAEVVKVFQEYLHTNSSLMKEVIQAMKKGTSIEEIPALSLNDFLSELDMTGAKLELLDGGYLYMAGIKPKTTQRLESILQKNFRLKEEVCEYALELRIKSIMREAVVNEELLDSIKFQAWCRWIEGYSHSLRLAIVEMYRLNESDTQGLKSIEDKRIEELQPLTDWEAEIESYAEKKD